MLPFARTARGLALGIGLLLALLSPARAQDATVRLMAVSGDPLSAETMARLQSSYSDERARLQVRLKANSPNATPGALTTSLSELEGRAIDGAMSHAIVVAPHGSPVVVGLLGQTDEKGARQLVLYNLTAWINHGHRLGAGAMETFAILDDSKIRGPGDAFTVDGVQYLARSENGVLSFRRN